MNELDIRRGAGRPLAIDEIIDGGRHAELIDDLGAEGADQAGRFGGVANAVWP